MLTRAAEAEAHVCPLLEFEGCCSRIARAEAHHANLAKTWNEFIDEEPYYAYADIASDGSGHLLVEPRYSPLPDMFAIELGEFLYQIRAALDASVYAVAIRETGKDPPPNARDLGFPICASLNEFRRQDTRIRPLRGTRREFIESVQPFNMPDLSPELAVFNFNRMLGVLNHWSIIDRHRRLHVVGSWASDASPKLRLPVGCRLQQIEVREGTILESDGVIASFRLSGFVEGMDVQVNPDVTIGIAVDEAPRPCADNDTLANRMRCMIKGARFIAWGLERSFLDEEGVEPAT